MLFAHSVLLARMHSWTPTHRPATAPSALQDIGLIGLQLFLMPRARRVALACIPPWSELIPALRASSALLARTTT